MRINAIEESLHYNEHRKFNDKSEHNTKQNNDNGTVSFAEILMQVKEDSYLQNDSERINEFIKYDI